MKDQIQHIFFDLDHTLWDFETNSSQTLLELHDEFNLSQKHNISPDAFVNTYSKVNVKMWELYNQNKISKNELRDIRFNETLEAFNVTDKPLSHKLNDSYLTRCPKRGHLLPGCIDVLNYLKPKYQLHILTNGFKESQSVKMESSGLSSYFEHVITPHCSGYQKPHPKMYYYALSKSKATKENSIMIGDNIKTDILGAKRIKMKTIWFNPELETNHRYKGIAIRSLEEIKTLL